ncbi:MAG: hypothetical protein CMD65_00180 [Gammaproteobacteria bacterium]|nr:hypothetical protein [Gammaproteobacteria bacterium]|tara:strand:- start:678 stop:1862 length:1185 start_codon:yes stop_codon:yes gene_type:complete
MFKKVSLIILYVFFLNSYAQEKNIINVPQYDISILTIGPGNSLSDAFGHSGIRVIDRINNFDIVFNYGVYDYNAPNFYANFVKGRPIYSLGINNYEDFYKSYVNQSRQIIEQKINLSEYQKKLLVNKLITNSKEPNRYYEYNYFENNCSTKIADIFNEILGEEIVKEGYNLNNSTSNTNRKLIYKHINPNSWGALGIDICLGAVIDKNISLKQEFFLPFKLKSYFDSLGKSNIKNGELVKTSIIYGKYSDYNENYFSPVYTILILSLIIILITFFDYLRLSSSTILDSILLLISGLVGLLLIYLWFFSNHLASAWNYNLLWAMPFNLILLIGLLKKNKSKWILPYLKFNVLMLLLLSLHWLIGVQVFNISLISLILALIIRYLYLINYYSKRIK